MTDLEAINLSSGHGSLVSIIDKGIDALFEQGVSDITIQADDYIWAYHQRVHKLASDRRLDEGEVKALVRHFYNGDAAFGMLGSGKALDFEVEIRSKIYDAVPDPDHCVRCRVNVTRCRVANVPDGYSITLRTIPGLPPRLEELNLEADVIDTFFPTQGLVLVVGATGSGKTTLLAAASRYRLEQSDKPVKILTFDDPIEFIFSRLPVAGLEKALGERPRPPRMPEVSQVQIGRHIKGFEEISRNILRRKADVIIIGEMRDRVSFETGLLLAQTGHVTYGTLHCETPAQAIARIISEFEIDGQPGVANKLLDSLRLIVAQKITTDVNKKARAFRSWIIFDHALKEKLNEIHFAKWSTYLVDHMSRNKAGFVDQALPAYLNNEISEESFANISGFNPIEARSYLSQYRAMKER